LRYGPVLLDRMYPIRSDPTTLRAAVRPNPLPRRLRGSSQSKRFDFLDIV